MDDVVIKLNDRCKVAGIFLDLSSAFDSVDHEILLQKLNHYGIRNEQLKLLANYLKNRKSYVELKYVYGHHETVYKSNTVEFNRGVPQGSILGPIFFNAFINDLIRHISGEVPDIKPIIFADDTNAIISAPTLDDLKIKITRTLEAFQNWFSINNLLLNNSKTNVMLFRTTARNKDSLNIRINDQNIVLLMRYSFLGL